MLRLLTCHSSSIHFFLHCLSFTKWSLGSSRFMFFFFSLILGAGYFFFKFFFPCKVYFWTWTVVLKFCTSVKSFCAADYRSIMLLVIIHTADSYIRTSIVSTVTVTWWHFIQTSDICVFSMTTVLFYVCFSKWCVFSSFLKVITVMANIDL